MASDSESSSIAPSHKRLCNASVMEEPDSVSVMAVKRVKLSDKTEGHQEPRSMETDRLSDLPDPIIHQIFSLVPTIVAIRMSLLSKRWSHMWYNLSALSFSDYDVHRGNFDQKRFFKFVKRCLELRKSDLVNVTGSQVISFKLSLYKFANSYYIHSWLNSVAQSNVRELFIDINCGRYPYCLRPSLLQSRTLMMMRLCNIRLWNVKSVNLPSLVSLSLESVQVNDKGLRILLSGCSSLENLLIKFCGPLTDVWISNSSLKSLELGGDELGIRFWVDAPNLQSVACSESCGFIYLHLLPSYEALRILSLTSCPTLYDDTLEDLITRLPILESLTLHRCEALEHVKFSSHRLKRLILEGNGEWIKVKVTVDAPNLVYFSFEGYLKPQFSINPRNLFEAKIMLDLDGPPADTNWYINLLNFLSSLNCSENLSLIVRCDKNLIMPIELRRTCGAPLPILKHLKVMTRIPSRRSDELRDALNWIAPSLETLSVLPN